MYCFILVVTSKILQGGTSTFQIIIPFNIQILLKKSYLYHICNIIIIEVTNLIKIRNKLSFTAGVIILLLAAPSGVLSDPVSFSSIFMILFSAYLILDGILDQKTKILALFLGFALLISFIWLIAQRTLSPIDTIFGVIIVLYANILGLLLYLGILPEKWIRA